MKTLIFSCYWDSDKNRAVLDFAGADLLTPTSVKSNGHGPKHKKPARTYTAWTEDEDNKLKSYRADNISYKQIGKALLRTEVACQARAIDLGIARKIKRHEQEQKP